MFTFARGMHTPKSTVLTARQNPVRDKNGSFKQAGAHERPRESGSFRMSAMTLFWYTGPIAAMAFIRFAQ